MAFRKFVETGRVAYIAEGDYEGKLVGIVNIIDQNRVLVDGPVTGVPRQEIAIKRLHLTNHTLPYTWTAPSRIVKKAWEDAKIEEKWANSRWCQRVQARNKKATLTDFERFKLQKARRARNKIRSHVFFQLLKSAKAKGGLVPRKTRYGKTKKGSKAPPKKK